MSLRESESSQCVRRNNDEEDVRGGAILQEIAVDVGSQGEGLRVGNRGIGDDAGAEWSRVVCHTRKHSIK